MSGSSPLGLDGASTLAAEALVLNLLGKALYTYPDRAWLQSLADEGVFAECPFGSEQPDVMTGLALLQKWSPANQGGMSDEAFDELRLDYTRLFIGPGKVLAPPWESVNFSDERLTFQAQTLQIRDWYRRFGLQAEKLHHEPDDHIGLELAFISHLASLAANALGTAHDDLLAAQRDFLTEHVLAWAPAWCSQVCDHAQTDFYWGIARLTRGVLLEAASMLELRVPEAMAA